MHMLATGGEGRAVGITVEPLGEDDAADEANAELVKEARVCKDVSF